MQKLSKTQQEIEVLAERVPQLTDAQKAWAVKQFYYFRQLPKDATEMVCPDCHGQIRFDSCKVKDGSKWRKDDKTVICPHCGAKIQIGDDYGRKRYNNLQEDFFQVMNVVGDWQVTRNFYMCRTCYLRKENSPWEFYEVCQAWNNPAYPKTHFRALPKKMMCNWCFNPWAIARYAYECNPDEESYRRYVECYNTLEPRRVGSSNYFGTASVAPNARILPSYKRMGLNPRSFKETHHSSALWLFESMSGKNYKPMYETLLKCGEYKIYDRVTDCVYTKNADAYFTAWKICRRNRYDYKKDLKEWLDLVELIAKRGLDYHNPHYVCPSDLHGAHNALLALEERDERIRRERMRREHDEQMRREAEEAMKRAKREEKAFIKRREKYFDLCIEGKEFKIVPLMSIEEFKEEGNYLHHCVFRCGYYRKADSLILSARDAHNNPIETLEIDLISYRILQCYGDHDEFSELHDEIKNVMNDNMWRVKEIARGKVKVAC